MQLELCNFVCGDFLSQSFSTARSWPGIGPWHLLRPGPRHIKKEFIGPQSVKGLIVDLVFSILFHLCAALDVVHSFSLYCIYTVQ